MKSIKYVLTIAMLFSAIIRAQDITIGNKKIDISGSVDAYFRNNISAPNDEDQISTPTAFAENAGFALGMVNIIASHDGKKVGFVGDLVFGPRGEVASSSVVNQLFVYWKVSDKFKLTFGKFNTYIGYELISPLDNFNYSTSYLFSNGPFSHTGLKAEYAPNKDWSFLFALMNQADADFNTNGRYAAGLEIGYSGHFLNFLYENDNLGFEVDYACNFDITSKYRVGINASYDRNDGSGFYGVALYPQYTINEKYAIGLRTEYFETFSNVVSDDPNVLAFTLTGDIKIENLIIKPELRLDDWSENVFVDTDLNPADTLSSFLLAAIYKF
ncbi:MAG: porin [Winogradskyella sp.]|nr:MAG: porin [Winogradskyella sp.]